ncbi:hypothetical protein A8F94_06560 [Bacillus sp. FJAT-27225]|uniref:EcsC family protein n=1 Tax=Bacillus sp. FJAT-27225 TaxID=1743144 RepID=UPI00080C2A4C|nr:EcsC family protein [Bacillus sp. FJAT-27225]OCA87525.1 hypothetical protein A8F94_06560 [Bacillus sp. FJAT-27225]
METNEWLQKELELIGKWEKDQGSLMIWERLGRLPYKLLDKITPKFIHEKIGVLLDELGSYIQTGGKYLINEKAAFKLIEKSTGNKVESFTDAANAPIAAMDQACSDLAGQRKKFAAFQGASTGIGGIFTLAVDIPALLATSLKTLQEIALIYGYDPNEKNERIFIVKCLQFSSADIVGKQAILNSLSAAGRQGEVMSELQGWREVVYAYRDQFGWKKLFQMVPIAGIVFGAWSNRSMIADLSETGQMLYKKRRILDRLAENEQNGEKLS